MGGNGTASVLGSIPASEREYVSLGSYKDPVYGDVEIIEWKGGSSNKMPPESNSAPRIYASFYKDGSGVNEIAKYGNDHKKEWAIHTAPHASNKAKKKGEAVEGPHIHKWKDGKPSAKPDPLLSGDPRLDFLSRLMNFQKTK